MPTPVCHHIGIEVSDLDASIRFYGGLLGLRCHGRGRWEEHGQPAGEFIFAEAEGLRLELMQACSLPWRPRPRPQPPCWRHPHVALTSTDIAADHARLLAAGATILEGPLQMPGCQWLFFADPDDFVLELVNWA